MILVDLYRRDLTPKILLMRFEEHRSWDFLICAHCVDSRHHRDCEIGCEESRIGDFCEGCESDDGVNEIGRADKN